MARSENIFFCHNFVKKICDFYKIKIVYIVIIFLIAWSFYPPISDTNEKQPGVPTVIEK